MFFNPIIQSYDFWLILGVKDLNEISKLSWENPYYNSIFDLIAPQRIGNIRPLGKSSKKKKINGFFH